MFGVELVGRCDIDHLHGRIGAQGLDGGVGRRAEVAFELGAVEAGRSGFRLACRVTRPRPDGGADPIALVETGLVSFDYAARRIARLPAAVAAVCGER